MPVRATVLVHRHESRLPACLAVSRVIREVNNAAPTTAERARPFALVHLTRHVVARRRRRAHGDRRGIPPRTTYRLATARGRDARALRRPAAPSATSFARSSASAAARRCTSCSRGWSRTRAAGSWSSASSRRCSRSRASPLIAVLVARLADRTVALAATALSSASWVLLFHGIYARMYSLFLFTATLSYLALLRALERRDRRSWILWALTILACIATHPYGALVLALAGSLRALRPQVPRGCAGVLRRRVARDPVLAQRHRAREPLRRRRRRRRREARQPLRDLQLPLARRGRLHRGWTPACCRDPPRGRVGLGDARARNRRGGASSPACSSRRRSSSSSRASAAATRRRSRGT